MPGADDDGPAVVVQLAGMVALVALAGIDAWSNEWNPELRDYAAGVIVVVWGPTIVTALVSALTRSK